MPKKTTKKENTVFVLHYVWDNDNVEYGVAAVYAALLPAQAALRQIIDGAPFMKEGNTIRDVMHRYDPEDPCDWEITDTELYYHIGSDSCSNWLALTIEEKTINE